MTMHFVALFLTAALAFSAGWFLASFFVVSSHASDISDLQAERQLLEEEREYLHRSWQRLEVVAPEERVTFDLGAHKRVSVS
jgi:hypothetical protein